MSAPFDGPGRVVSDLRVGEIRAVRTFRLSPDGSLLPVAHSSVPWSDGPNTARCSRDNHTPAAPGCWCGFYAYGTVPAASQYAEAKRVLAVVACWGRVVPGTLGLRAQHARIEALWVSSRVNRRHVAHVRSGYPSVVLYRSRRKMIRRHQPTHLDSYVRQPQQRARPARPVRDPLSTRATLVACLTFLVMTALTGVITVGGGLLIIVLWHLLHNVL